MAWAFRHVLCASLALELTIDRAEKRIVETAVAGLRSGLVHCLRIHDVSHAHGLDFLGRQETELNLLNRAERRTRVRENKIRHFFGLKINARK